MANKQTTTESTTLKKYSVEYWYQSCIWQEVEATSEDKAKEKVREMIENGEIDLSSANLADDGYEVTEIK